MIKAVFFDADGTLISHSKNEVSQSSREALEELRKKGIKCILATGRHMSELQDLPIKDIEFDAYITVNGQLCMEAEGSVFCERPISGKDKEILVELFNNKTIPIALVEKDAMYLNFVNHYVEKAQHAVSSPLPKLGEYGGGEIYLAVAYLGREDEEHIRSLLPGCKATRWNDFGVDIISKSGGKLVGIDEYLKLSGISRDEAMAFGDGENDIDMLKNAGIGVAMGNAKDTVKESADYVTASVDDDGIKKALEYFELL